MPDIVGILERNAERVRDPALRERLLDAISALRHRRREGSHRGVGHHEPRRREAGRRWG